MVRPRPDNHSRRGARRGAHSNNSRLTQSTLQGTSLAAADSEAFGHPFPNSPATNCSIVTFQNIGPQPQFTHSSRSSRNSTAFSTSHACLSLLAEHCLNERALEPQHYFSRRLSRASSSAFSYLTNNSQESTDWRQPGGTGFIANHTFMSHKISHGADPTGLGRWSFLRLRGKHGATISFFSAYRPCHNTPWLGSVWNQHLRYFQLQGVPSPDPCSIFDADLLAAVTSALDAGDNVVIGIDNNADVRSSELATRFTALGLSDAILTQHAPASPPATHNRNTRRIPIDTIWVSPGIVVNRSGYLPFDSSLAMCSDHRLLWIEIDNSSALGKYLPSPVTSRPSKIRFKDPRSRALYTKRVLSALQSSGCSSQLVALQDQADAFSKASPADQASLLPSLKSDYDRVHSLLDSIRSSVESKLRPLCMGAVPYSPQIQRYRDTIDYWNKYVKLRQGVNTSRVKLRRIGRRLGLPFGPVVTLPYAVSRLKEAYQAYRAAKPNADAMRKEYLSGCIKALVLEGLPGNSSADAIRARMKREKHAILLGQGSRRITGKGDKFAIFRAESTAPDGSIVEHHTQEDMVEAMRVSNLSRQQQCLGTPSMSPPFTNDFGYLADTPSAIQVIEGVYTPPPGTDPYLCDLLRDMAMPDTIRALGPCRISITPEENRRAWHSQSAKTAGEPSSLSFVHYKTASLDPTLNKIDTFMRSLPLAAGFSPNAWQTITDVEILKKPGVYDVDKMRLIQLMSPEFQINNKLVGKQILAHAERAGAVSDDQHGSRKGHTAINTCLSKRLLCDLFRQKRRAAAVAMNDAKGCYDRISHPIAVLVLMRFGLPQRLACTLISTLQKAVHHIKTGYGRSGPVYGNELIPLSGIGQGNGLGPTLWALISTVLLVMMRRAGHGVSLTSALTSTVIALVGFAFVDDTDLFCAGSSNTSSGEDLSADFQLALDRWSGALRATGGALAPTKSFCYLLDFEWTGSLWEYRSMPDMPGEFTLAGPHNTSRPLKRYEPSHAEKTLGAYIAMDGNEEAEFKHLLHKSVVFGAKMKASTCTRNEALYTFQACHLPSLEYALPVTNLSKAQWDKILSPALVPSLHKAGISKNISRTSVFGPTKYQGFGIRHPYFSQQIRHISTLFQEVHAGTQTGLILRATAEQFRLELGFPFDINACDYRTHSVYITDTWYKALWRFLSCNPSITITEDFPDPPRLRHNDSYLMQRFRAAGFKGKELRLLNEIRMAMRVITVADIATADGDSIRHSAFLLQRGNGLREDYDWPRPVPLSDDLRDLWQRALRSSILVYPPPENEKAARKLRFHLRVGIWHSPEVADLWDWFWCTSTGRLYHKTPLGWETWIRHLSRRNRVRYKLSELNLLPTKPDSVTLMLSVSPRNSMVAREGSEQWRYQEPSPPRDDIDPASSSFTDIQDAAQAFIESPGVLLDDLTLPSDQGVAIAAAISAGTAVAVSDGSFCPVLKRATSAFILSPSTDCTDESEFVTGANLITGNEADLNPYRAELGGPLAILAAIDLLVSFYRITSGAVTIAFDGKAALDEAAKTSGLSASQPCFDYLQVIQNRVAALPIDVHWRWVRGHQREQGIQDIDWWGKMNDLVDSKAKAFRVQHYEGDIPTELYFSTLFYEQWTITLSHLKQPALVPQQCYDTLFKPQIQSYWETHHDIPIPSCDQVDWEPSSKAIQRLPLGLRRWHLKFRTGSIGVGNQLFHRKHQPHSNCPLCETPNEKVSHVLHCPDPAATAFATERIRHHVPSALEDHKTEPVLSVAIQEILLAWRRGEPIAPIHCDPSIRHVIIDQCRLGWDNFVLGRWCPSWRVHQAAYYTSIGSRRSSLRWATAMIEKLMLVSWDLWQYRNNRLHAPSGPRELERHDTLNFEIDSEFALGSATLVDASRYLIESRSLADLHRDSLEGKQQWLRSVRAARHELAANLGTPPPALTAQAARFRNYFGLPATPPTAS